ncbi:helix-turn-helix transcriptional regulator [Gracilibacillus caseinilyticus]|uniref:Helix-turn-helix transcriptional regulator n=1 Tax=Gracilibacillus caseinilyticus TaxID=2932256 RepID=A0ABY4F0A1_9BACI|nr:helix-turn-helix domain-containing protein [Gracilibacillus caseinilyticus]UOQ49950.1 helix-turn-helix transcriptional regulator [Gracilibacillus caseinilyticus]
MFDTFITDKETLLHTAYETMGIPIMIINDQSKFNCIPENFPLNPLFSEIRGFIETICLLRQQSSLIETDYSEKIVSIPFDHHNEKGWLIIGPTVYPEPKSIAIEQLLSHLQKKYLLDEMEDYYLSLPVIDRTKLLKSSNLIYYLLFHEQISLDQQLPVLDEDINGEKMPKHIQYIDQKRQNASFHHDPLLERKCYQFVEDGNISEVIPYFKAFTTRPDFEHAILSTRSELRNQQNLTIALVTQATRAAIRGGVHPEIAYSLGDAFIQQSEGLTTPDRVIKLKEEIMYEFAAKVAKSKKLKYTKVISQCQAHIYKHLYDKELGLAKLAEDMKINKKYLSNLFKKEVGISISSYIQKVKIDEAKKLMFYSDYTLIQICSLLNFSDQSYFTKIFKKHTKMTPRQFLQKPLI